MTVARTSFLTDTLIPAAIARWSSMLSVVPVSGPLYAHRTCTSYWQTTTPYKCAQFAGATTCGNNGYDLDITFNSTFLGVDVNYTAGMLPVYQPAGAGLAGADYGLFVTAVQTPMCGTGGSGVLAYAASCQRDQYDRPTWGRVNFCPVNLDPSSDKWDAQLGVAVHELAHALGFSAASWPLFRDSSNSMAPRTPRDAGYPFLVSANYRTPAYSGTGCGSAVSWSLPSSTTVNYMSERGMTCSMDAPGSSDFPGTQAPPLKAVSDCVHKLVTPKVLAAARDFFGCSSLNGAELENQLTSSCDIQGSHWEQRILSTELMASYTQHTMKVSPMTLAAFEDSGWYVANYSNADKWRPGQDWGYRQGCSFATDKCLDSTLTGTGTPPHFYGTAHGISSGSGNAVCTIDNLAVGYVGMSTYSSALPSQYQYWSGQTTKGGSPPSTFDFCPAVQAYSNRKCSVAANQYGNAAAYFGEYYGAGSSCFTTTLMRSIYSGSGNGAGCYLSTCVWDTGTNHWTLRVRVSDGGIYTSDVTCTAKGQVITGISGFSGSLTCPDPDVTCHDGYTWDPNNGPTSSPSPSNTASHTPSRSMSPSTSPAALLLTIPFVFVGINISTALALDATTGLPPANGSPLVQALLSDVCNITGTCGSVTLGYPPLMYLHRAVDGDTGIDARFAFSTSTGKAYLTSITYPNGRRRLTGSVSASVTLTLAYRAVSSAPSPAAGATPNPSYGSQPVNTTTASAREATVQARLAAVTSLGNSAFQLRFQAMMSAYCSLIGSSGVSCATNLKLVVTTASASTSQGTAYPAGSPAQPSSGPGGATPSNDGAATPSILVIALAACGGGALLIGIIACSWWCCRANNNGGADPKVVVMVVTGGSSASAGTSVGSPVGAGGALVLRDQPPYQQQQYAQQQFEQQMAPQGYTVALPQKQSPSAPGDGGYGNDQQAQQAYYPQQQQLAYAQQLMYAQQQQQYQFQQQQQQRRPSRTSKGTL